MNINDMKSSIELIMDKYQNVFKKLADEDSPDKDFKIVEECYRLIDDVSEICLEKITNEELRERTDNLQSDAQNNLCWMGRMRSHEDPI